ncbi:hypothetical protein V7R84_12155 [Arachnia propionica]|uniref:hypothetical protein n=1 Tax=Arachnia propionica TaxID=1750 RepID=UPI0030D0FB90
MFAALEIVTGKVAGFFEDRYRHQEFLGFLKYVARAYLGREFHLVVDNYVAYKRVEVCYWFTANSRIRIRFALMLGLWLNLVEVWFGIFERQIIRGGTFVSVRELIGKIREFVNGWDNRKYPFVWTKTSEEILAKIDRKRKLTSTPLGAHHAGSTPRPCDAPR